jgi:uroporphyrinogen-III synthase
MSSRIISIDIITLAQFLQKHIIFRKRKIFYGTGTPQSVVALVTAKHKGEKFLITTAEGAHNEAITGLFAAAGLNYETGAFVKPVSQDLKDIDINSYDLAVVYNPADLKALQENFPDFKADKLKFVTFGKQIVNELESQGLPIAISAPTPEVPSVAKALEVYLSSL